MAKTKTGKANNNKVRPRMVSKVSKDNRLILNKGNS